MEASEPKWVNPILKIIGLTHLGSEASIYNMKQYQNVFLFTEKYIDITH